MAEDVILYPVRNQLKKFFGGRDKLYPFMELNTMDMVVWRPDMVVGAPDGAFTDIFGEKASGGSITGSVANTVNGICRLTTGGTNNNYCYIFPNGGESMKGACFLPTHNPVMWVRLTVNAITSVKIECGFTDADDDAGAVTTLSTPDCLASDCALWCFDTADTSALYWQGVTNLAGEEGTKYEPETHTPVASTYEWLGVAIQGGAVKFMHMDANGNPNGESGWLTGRITSADPLIPWVGAHTRMGTTRLLDIECIMAWQRRTTADD